jgi:hypothetical protein
MVAWARSCCRLPQRLAEAWVDFADPFTANSTPAHARAFLHLRSSHQQLGPSCASPVDLTEQSTKHAHSYPMLIHPNLRPCLSYASYPESVELPILPLSLVDRPSLLYLQGPRHNHSRLLVVQVYHPSIANPFFLYRFAGFFCTSTLFGSTSNLCSYLSLSICFRTFLWNPAAAHLCILPHSYRTNPDPVLQQTKHNICRIPSRILFASANV